jgi:hypothetical protein
LDTTTEQRAARAFYENVVEVRRAAHADQVVYEKTLDRAPSSTATSRPKDELAIGARRRAHGGCLTDACTGPRSL